MWAGEVTNDTFGPLRVPRRAVRRSAAQRAKPQLARLTRLGPPAGAGRWSLVAPLLEPAPAPTEIAHAQALQLLERHGVVTREGVRAEGVAGGFAAVYPVLRALEESGRARRGWFVAGLGAAQFALPGAVDRVRAYRTITADEPHAIVLAATDPAQPYGAALGWPERKTQGAATGGERSPKSTSHYAAARRVHGRARRAGRRRTRRVRRAQWEVDRHVRPSGT